VLAQNSADVFIVRCWPTNLPGKAHRDLGDQEANLISGSQLRREYSPLAPSNMQLTIGRYISLIQSYSQSKTYGSLNRMDCMLVSKNATQLIEMVSICSPTVSN
jgi:hypothetical protein